MNGLFRSAATVALSLALIEGVLRLFALASASTTNPIEHPGRLVPGSTRISITEGYGLRTVNEIGFFDQPLRPDSELAFRVLLLGDSYSEALQVRDLETFDAVAERRLADSAGAVEIVDLGRSGYGTADELAVYLDVADRLPHRFVLLQFTENDFKDNLRHAPGRESASAPVAAATGGPLQRLHLGLRETSVLYNRLVTRSYQLEDFLRRRSDPEVESESLAPDEQQIELAGELLGKLKAAVDARGARLLVFQIPHLDRREDESNPVLVELCRRNGIEMLPVFADLRALYDSRPEFKLSGFLNTTLGEGHLNPAGHAALGGLLAGYLSAEAGRP